MKDKLSDGSWSNYVPNDEWKLLEFERNNPIRAKQDCIGEYGLSINDNDFKYMCDYLLSNDGPSFMKDTDERIEEKRCKLVRTPCERSANLEHEFDEWARTNCLLPLLPLRTSSRNGATNGLYGVSTGSLRIAQNISTVYTTSTSAVAVKA
ncbi:hypothetical protein Tco_1229754 [Tanacetum coccineum]